jgi:hypothetical protein
MQMCDALSRNEPKEFHTLLCHCLLQYGIPEICCADSSTKPLVGVRTTSLAA